MNMTRKVRRVVAASLIPVGLTAASISAAGASTHEDSWNDAHPSVFTVHTILSGMTLSHTFTPSGATSSITDHLTKPDDLSSLDNHVFVGFQNGVGPNGEPSADGNVASTVVEMNRIGDPINQWDVVGKIDGFTADPETHLLIVTVNEDGNSSLYTIDPSSSAIVHYTYNSLPHNGGTDSVAIYHGQILISASAPGSSGAAAPQPTYPAVYSISLNPGTKVATATPLFYDEDSATIANLNSPQVGQQTPLGLTDPDSSTIVPEGARFGGDYVLDSQGDQQLIFVRGAGQRHQSLSVLSLSQSIDDAAWTAHGQTKLYSTDSTNDSVDTVTGPFSPNQPMVVATPCGANSAPSNCSTPNYLATLDPATGQVSAVTTYGALYTPQGGLIAVASDHSFQR